jgi:dolichol-phosphate mannosyltransferase
VADSLVIIPTYKEKENIEKIIRKVFSLDKQFEILIIDDNSPDGTAQIVKSLQKEFPNNLHIVERAGKLGLGTAYIAGFKWALARHYDYVMEMDADFSHNPEDLIQLYNACTKEGGDMSIGSRYKSGVNVVNWPMGRVLMSYFASMYVRIVTGMKIMDTTAGFVCYSRKVLETIDLDNIKLKGYAFQIEMKFTTWKFKFKIVEVPIVFTDRRFGVSKMSGGIFNEALWGVVKMKLQSFFKSYKRK